MDSYSTLISSYGLTAEEGAAAVGVFGVLAGMMTVIAVVSLVIWILLVIAQWRIFTKAGEKGWKSIIPIYNMYVYSKILGLTKWFWIFFIGSLACSLLSAVPVLGVILAIAFFVITIIYAVLMAKNGAKAFGKGTGFAVGLFFLPNIFELILGFGSAEYQGVPSKD